MKKVYIFGHKNPDTDSVCSAIALANLKNELGVSADAKVIGQMNRETNFVLNYFKVDSPSYINDVKIQIKDINYTKKAYINENKSILDAFNSETIAEHMRKENTKPKTAGMAMFFVLSIISPLIPYTHIFRVRQILN